MKTYMPMTENRDGIHYPEMYEAEGGEWVSKEDAKKLYETLWFVLSRIDGDLRATARDINNQIGSGNDIYDDCDFIEERVRATLSEVDGEEV